MAPTVAQIVTQIFEDHTLRGLKLDAQRTSKKVVSGVRYLKASKSTRKHMDVEGIDTRGGVVGNKARGGVLGQKLPVRRKVAFDKRKNTTHFIPKANKGRKPRKR